MDRLAMRRFFVAPFLMLMAAGCAHVVSPEVREMARKDVNFPMVLANPEVHHGDVVIWGGVIIGTQNRPEGTTVMVLETPLDGEGAPADAEYSRGRFLAKTPSFLDGEIYQKGRKVTVAGEVVGREIQSLGDIRYGYPVLSVREIHLWREHWTGYGYPYGPYSYWGPYYGYGHWWWPHRRWHYRYR